MNKVYATSYADSEQDMIEELNHIKISQFVEDSKQI